MCTLSVDLAENVEQERLHVEIEGFMVEEELGHQAQVLAIKLVILPISLPD